MIMTSYCKYCGKMVSDKEILHKKELKKYGNVYLTDHWIGCIECYKRQPSK